MAKWSILLVTVAFNSLACSSDSGPTDTEPIPPLVYEVTEHFNGECFFPELPPADDPAWDVVGANPDSLRARAGCDGPRESVGFTSMLELHPDGTATNYDLSWIPDGFTSGIWHNSDGQTVLEFHVTDQAPPDTPRDTDGLMLAWLGAGCTPAYMPLRFSGTRGARISLSVYWQTECETGDPALTALFDLFSLDGTNVIRNEGAWTLSGSLQEVD